MVVLICFPHCHVTLVFLGGVQVDEQRTPVLTTLGTIVVDDHPSLVFQHWPGLRFRTLFRLDARDDWILEKLETC